VVNPLMISHFPNWRRWHTFRLETSTGTHPSRIFAIAGAAAMDSFVGEVWLGAGSPTVSAQRSGLPAEALRCARVFSVSSLYKH
jgi:hypothetical protein